jgi:hypothetical protein
VKKRKSVHSSQYQLLIQQERKKDPIKKREEYVVCEVATHKEM